MPGSFPRNLYMLTDNFEFILEEFSHTNFNGLQMVDTKPTKEQLRAVLSRKPVINQELGSKPRLSILPRTKLTRQSSLTSIRNNQLSPLSSRARGFSSSDNNGHVISYSLKKRPHSTSTLRSTPNSPIKTSLPIFEEVGFCIRRKIIGSTICFINTEIC